VVQDQVRIPKGPMHVIRNRYMMFRSAAIVFCVTLLLPSLAFACPQTQTQPKTSSEFAQQSATIHATARLVQVTVIVQDKNGASISGLKKEDFALFDGGMPQVISFFSSATPARPPAHLLPPNVFTNRSDLKGQDPGATIVILFDELNTAFEDQAYARNHILRFLKTVKPQDHVAIFALTNDLVVLHDFTEDANALANSVSRFSPRLLAAFDASHPENFHVDALRDVASWRSFEDHVNNANGEIADSRVVDRYRITNSALAAIASYVEGIPGHKSLVWVSGGIPIQLGAGQVGVPDRDSFQFDNSGVPGLANASDVSGLARVLNRVNMAIYPIDAHGIEVDDSAAAFFLRQNQRDTFRLLADRTGGKAFYGTNDIAAAVNSAFEDGRYTYTLGFYPNHGVWDGKFREIKINLAVRDGHLRYRRGYFAFPERSESSATMVTDLQQAARSPVDATGLGLTVRGKALGPSSARTLLLQVGVDPKQFLLRDEDNHSCGGLDLLFLQRDAMGNFLAAEQQHFDVNFSQREYDSLVKTGLVLQRRLAVDPASVELRVLVRDAGSAAIGSVTVPVKLYF